jgi:hypothetical protein
MMDNINKYEFYVITHVPDLLEEGNTCHDFLWDGYDFSNKCKMIHAGHSNIGSPIGECKTAVFEKGEIVICDVNTGREIPYPGRKPSKWDIVYETFYILDNAINRANEICKEL